MIQMMHQSRYNHMSQSAHHPVTVVDDYWNSDIGSPWYYDGPIGYSWSDCYGI